jgi:hypothetical protein
MRKQQLEKSSLQRIITVKGINYTLEAYTSKLVLFNRLCVLSAKWQEQGSAFPCICSLFAFVTLPNWQNCSRAAQQTRADTVDTGSWRSLPLRV